MKNGKIFPNMADELNFSHGLAPIMVGNKRSHVPTGAVQGTDNFSVIFSDGLHLRVPL